VDFVKQFDIAPGVGSDAHDPEGIGAAYIEVPDFDGPHDMLSSLRQGRVVGEYRPHAARYARTVAEKVVATKCFSATVRGDGLSRSSADSDM
jgi:hypothetical protein